MPGALRKLQGVFIDKPPNYSEIDDRIAASGLPSRKKHMQYLKSRGVSAIISLTEQPLPKQLVEGFTYLHFPLKDHQPADAPMLMKIVEAMENLLSQGHKLLVHCQAGHGRTGMVLTAFHMKHDGLGWRECLEFVRRLRPGSVEAGQEVSLRELETLLKAGS
ncbi:MAG: dual specificity protein phosphatase family protein [Candidatus Caldarchaeum sp.]|uniref:Tyrosine specific protein phosphatases domain-containing protein n=1 Tax=Caldiarchaeum subterraneum TaxID=311458 RepID=A0A7J3VSF3_CALS0